MKFKINWLPLLAGLGILTILVVWQLRSNGYIEMSPRTFKYMVYVAAVPALIFSMKKWLKFFRNPEGE